MKLRSEAGNNWDKYKDTTLFCEAMAAANTYEICAKELLQALERE
jgi:hypothetical protein